MYDRAKSVGRMYYQKSGSWYLCTGSLISSNNHFLSNEHCVNSQAITDELIGSFCEVLRLKSN
ncbi:MAG: trypsin-like serine protease [Nitrospirae bacterium]|nr:trypsin-like serine protease [Nitrospirota bacterium]